MFPRMKHLFTSRITSGKNVSRYLKYLPLVTIKPFTYRRTSVTFLYLIFLNRKALHLKYIKCLTNEEFGKQAIMADLLYFKYYFLDALQRPYDKQKLIDDFEALSNYLTHTEYKHFMFRDFQSRNILVKEEQVHFIDFQGGMKGAPQYDVASMLWQARANLPEEWKTNLLEEYMDAFETISGAQSDRS